MHKAGRSVSADLKQDLIPSFLLLAHQDALIVPPETVTESKEQCSEKMQRSANLRRAVSFLTVRLIMKPMLLPRKENVCHVTIITDSLLNIEDCETSQHAKDTREHCGFCSFCETNTQRV